MKKSILVGACVFLVPLISTAAQQKTEYGYKDSTARLASLVTLMADPSTWKGKKVRVIGAIQLEFEGSQVCLSKEDLKFKVFPNCLWLKLDYKTLGTKEDELKRWNTQFVLLEGNFDPTDRGPFALQSGSIHSVTRVVAWEQEVPDK